jgi:hypothetical protein
MHKHSLHSSSDESSDGEMDIKPKRGKFAWKVNWWFEKVDLLSADGTNDW